jgi:hypothetical protein
MFLKKHNQFNKVLKLNLLEVEVYDNLWFAREYSFITIDNYWLSLIGVFGIDVGGEEINFSCLMFFL